LPENSQQRNKQNSVSDRLLNPHVSARRFSKTFQQDVSARRYSKTFQQDVLARRFARRFSKRNRKPRLWFTVFGRLAGL
jgi:hypothetical protein